MAHAALLVVGIAACHDTTGMTGPTPVSTVTVTPPSVVLVIGTSLTFQAELRDSAANVLTNRPITWRSSDTTIVRVSQAGLATAMNLGTATVTAASGGASGSATVYAAYICPCSPPSSGKASAASACACSP